MAMFVQGDRMRDGEEWNREQCTNLFCLARMFQLDVIWYGVYGTVPVIAVKIGEDVWGDPLTAKVYEFEATRDLVYYTAEMSLLDQLPHTETELGWVARDPIGFYVDI